MDNTMSMTRPPVTQLRPLHTQQQSPKESQPISWTSSVEPRPDEEIAIKAFVKLVSHLVILDEGENFCIQHTKRDIPSDFSIGEGKTLQLHFEKHQVQLKTVASIIPESALRSLGCMLDDILTGSEWTQPSVLNFPPRSEPLSFTHGDDTLTHDGAKISLLHHQFERRASESPERVAIDYLRDLENGSRVTFTYLLVGPCPELYVSYLAALKAGVAFCPIAVDAPRERKEALTADLKPSALLTTTSLLKSASSSFLNSSSETIDVTPFLQACDTEPKQQPTSASISPNDLAYILHTSGTTGLPKVVAVSHLSASCTISALSAHYGFPLPSPTSKPVRWFQGAAPTFDISLFEIFWTLSTGSTLCCAPREFTLQNIDKAVTALEADTTNITPSFASLLDPSSISGLMVGGETLNARLLQNFAPYNPTAKEEPGQVPRGIYNGYEPTETAIYSIAQAHVPEGQRGSVIGTPLTTCGVFIVQPLHVLQAGGSLKPLPIGAVGELVIAGPQVSKVGYLNRPGETAAAFRDALRWGRVYKTGDRARIVWDKSGSPMVEFLGRLSDDQVKLSGRRVELGEIESVLASKGAEAGSEKVVSLIVGDPNANFETVHQACLDASQHHLPDYMRPFKILQVDALPRSASGKADRKAAFALVNRMLNPKLDGRETTSCGMNESIEPLANPQDAEVEYELISIVSNVLNYSPTPGPSFTAKTVLVDAGIDSLRAMRILRDVRKCWPESQNPQLEPSLALLLDNSATIRSVFFPNSQDIDTSITKASKQTRTKAQLETFSAKHMPELLDKLNLSKPDIEMILPATSTQSQLVMSFAMDKRNYIRHNCHTTLKLKPDVSLQTLKDCIETTMSRQPIYRTAMLPCDDDLSPFLQVVLIPEAWQRLSGNSDRIAHRKTSPGSISAHAQTWLDLAEENLSLESHRLYQVQIIDPEEAGSGGLLTISAAHCICDGPSLEVLMTDLTLQYSGLEPLPRHGIYDAVFEWVSNINLETDQLWQKALEGWETEPLGAISGNNVKPTSTKTRQHAMVQHTSPIPWELLESNSRALGGSPLTILQASWAMLLHILSEADTDGVTFGSVLSGHDQFVHSPTFSVVTCRIALPEAQTLKQLVGTSMDHSRFAQSHRHTSFGVFKTLPYNTALALQAYSQTEEDGAGKPPLLWTEISNPPIRYDFAMFAEVFPTNPNSPERNGRFDDVVFKLTYRDETFLETSAPCIVKQFAALTETILKSLPDDLFEDQAASTPDLLALSFYSSLDSAPVEMSYAELDARANSLANILREQDIDIIPICMEHSVELYVSVLAILKAGSAWCPIDTTSPVQRRTSLIARAQSKALLITTESLPLVEPCLALEAVKDVQVILVDKYSDQSASVRAKPRNSISDITGQDLAYLLWTSGTTGEPKGVMIHHSAAAQAMRDLQVLVEHDDREQVRTLQLSAYSFDVFVQDLFYTWGLAGSVINAKAADVGFPLDHCTAYAVREVETSQGTKRRELVPRYGVGELTLGGAQVGKGYLANEAKTTKAFIQGGPGIDERIYLTGDLVRLNDHGFEFLGRNDDLVEITGTRIELSEISAACASLTDDDAAVEHVETLYLQRPSAPAGNNNKVVVIFVSVKTGNVDTSDIRSQVFKQAKDLLPAYMVPGHVVVLDTTMPRTASNKVNRKVLQAIYAESDLNVGQAAVDNNIKGNMRPSDTHHLNDVDDRQLKRAWAAAAKRFDILRTIFVPLTQLDVDGSDNTVSWAREKGVHSTILQLICEKPTLHWSQIGSEKDQSLGELAKKFQLELSPTTTMETPWAVTFVQSTKMMLSMHHALYDAVASDVFLETVTSLYHMESVGDAGGVVKFEKGLSLGLLPAPSKRDEAAALWGHRLEDISKTASGGVLNAPFPNLTQSRQKQVQKILMSRKDVPAPFLQSISNTVPVRFRLDSFTQISHATLPLIVRSNAASSEELWKEMATESAQMFQSTHNLHPVDVKKMLNRGKHPDWTAVEEVMLQSLDDDEEIASRTITYAQLDKLTNAIATRLTQQEARLQPDDPVAMCLGRDIMSLAVTLAIFRDGFVYLPVDEDIPSARKQLLILDAGAKLTMSMISSCCFSLTRNDDIDTILSWPVSEIPSATGTGGYLLYASGSTGRPKGVRVSNGNLCHFISAFSTRLIEDSPATARLGGVRKYHNLTSRTFDPHLTQLFVPWHLGHRVVIGRDRTAMMMNLKELINELNATHFGSVPSVLSQLRLQPEDVPSVRVVTTDGEKASNELLNTWSQTQDSDSADNQAVLFNFYGPTEVNIGCLGHAVHQNSNARNLGLPLQGHEALLLCSNSDTDSLVIARRGQPGELCIAGPQVAMGYLNRPVEQAKSFQTITLPGGISKKVYRTGDMMRMMNDGSLEFLGMADQQTKIRGQRLELDEVVGFLKQVAGDKGDVDFAATVASTGGDSSNRQQQLLGFIARNTGSPKIQAEQEVVLLEVQDEESASLIDVMERECQYKLSAFMVPKLVWVTKIPYLAASGKVDTKILARLAKDFLASQQDHELDDTNSGGLLGSGSSLSAKESVVVTAIEEAVGGSVKSSSTSSIQRLGIDSLSAVNLVSLLRKRGFSQLKMTHLLSSSCTVADIADIARLADEQESGSPSNSRPLSTPPSTDNLHTPIFSVSDLGPLPEGLDGSNIEGVLPCLPLQSALIAWSLFSYRLGRGTDINRWKKTAEQVIASESMLRTCFLQLEDDGQIFQVVLRSLPSSPLGGQGHPADVVSQMNARPPIRLQFSNVDGDKTIVSLNIHHALFDGVAVESLKNKLEAAYNSQTSSTAAANSLITLSTISNHCNLPNEQLDAKRRSCGTMDRQTLCLGFTTSELNARLKSHSLGLEGTVSASSAFQLAVTLCLVKLTKQPSIVYGFIISLRPLLDGVANDVDSFVGLCLNTLIRVAAINSLDETLPQLAQRVHRSHLDVSQGAMPLVSVEKVQRWSESEDKLFDSLLSINVVPVNEPSGAKPGQMTALPTRSSSDMALAFDVDLHADGKVMLTLSSAGALNVEQLTNVGQLFEKVVYSCTDKTVKASDVVTFPLAAMTVPTKVRDGPRSNGISTGTPSYNQELSDVQATLTRFVHLSPSELLSKPDSTTLYQLGLDSITVLPSVKSINKSHKTKLSSHAVIKARTIKGVAQLLQDAKFKSSSVDTTKLQSSSGHASSKLSDTELYDRTLERLAKSLMFIATPLQEGMLSASLATDGDAYTYVHAFQLSDYALAHDTPSLDKFFAAVKDTFQACEILRTRFILTDDDESPWVGIISPTEQSDRVSWEAQSTVPGRVHLRIHHSLYDAISIQSIWSVLQDYYSRRLNNDLSDGVDAATHLYRPFARTVACSQRASIAYWIDTVRGYTYTPLDFPSNDLKASSAVHSSFDTSKLSLLQSKCRDLGLTVKAALQLSWIKVLFESLYRQAGVVYGEVVSTDADDDVAIVGPAINTLPLRVKLGDSDGCINVSQALALVQKQIDSARGINSMASLRKIQTLWRSGQMSSDAPAALFQSLFVFDGVLGASNTSDDSEKLFKSVQAGAADTAGPAYDDYPLIVSFHVKYNILNGKLRAKLPQEQVNVLGKSLHAALYHVLHRLDVPVVDTKYLDPVSNTASPETKSDPAESDMNGLTPTANAALKLVETVVGTRRAGKKIGYSTRLITVGLDSILAIRLSKLLKQQLRLSVSVFEIMKGASVRDIIIRPASTGASSTSPSSLPYLVSVLTSNFGYITGRDSLKPPGLTSCPRLSNRNISQSVGLSLSKLTMSSELPLQLERPRRSCTKSLCQRSGQPDRASYQDVSKAVEELIAEHVSQENVKASDLKEPPVRLSFLEAADNKAVVLRLHHALYDAWSIKMIEQDLNNILNRKAEEAYWRRHLSGAEETILGHNVGHTVLSAHGPQFKTSSNIVPHNSIRSLLQKSSPEVSAALILSYARTLQHFTQHTKPTFGLNHASRSLSSPDGTQTLDLTVASTPTLSMTPFSIDLELSTEELLGFIQDHLAQLNCFSQADDVRKLSPMFNVFLFLLSCQYLD
ncbi:Ferrichrome siderophore peptide synthetase [Fusarium agapanthi]|uniref:Ferrichrome siderophore peptide synthetase n=1 Tax=Fusarium agapanthi TaxID=1803897 RepID=A0A9P5B2V9_9HYPO|nr:Ferrichrome siderophore peptide synthetase [Fusarium agapanthi]